MSLHETHLNIDKVKKLSKNVLWNYFRKGSKWVKCQVKEVSQENELVQILKLFISAFNRFFKIFLAPEHCPMSIQQKEDTRNEKMLDTLNIVITYDALKKSCDI